MQCSDLPGIYLQDSRLQKMLKARCINEMKQILQNDDLAENFIPTYSVGCSRLTPSPGYLEVHISAHFIQTISLTKYCRQCAKTM